MSLATWIHFLKREFQCRVRHYDVLILAFIVCKITPVPRVFTSRTRARDFVSDGNNGGTKSIPQVTCPPRPRPRRRNMEAMTDTKKTVTLHPLPVILLVFGGRVSHSSGIAMPHISFFTLPNTPSEVPNTAHS